MILRVAFQSLVSRKGSVLLTLLSVIVSITILLTVEQVRSQVKQSFTRTVSGVDLIVGAPTGELTLLLSSVFHIGNVPKGMPWRAYGDLAANKQVDWLIPLSLGDSHNGYRVVGTTAAFFTHYRYGDKTPLTFAEGAGFASEKSLVLGSKAATALGYNVGNEVVISHGVGNVSFTHHDDFPFTVSGILSATGTPLDQAIYVTLAGVTRMHAAPVGTISRSISRRDSRPHDHDDEHNDTHADDTSHAELQPESISAILVGLTSRVAALQVQHQVNNASTPLLAILPGVALNQLWSIMGNLEALLFSISVLIFVSSVLGLMTMLLATMRERKQEIAVFRVIGAGPLTILWLIQLEALLIGAVACAVSLGMVSLLPIILGDWIASNYGIYFSAHVFNPSAIVVIVGVLLTIWLSSFIPAISAYKQALHSGLQAR